MKKTIVKSAAACGLCLTLLASGISASAAYNVGIQNRMGGMQSGQQQMLGGRQGGQFGGMQQGGQPGGMQQGGPFGGMQQGGMMGGQMGGMTQNGMTQTASSAGAIVAGELSNSAASLEADYNNATTYDVSEGSVKITEAGTYIITGSNSDGNITVKKGTTGVVLVLKDLNLASSTGAALSINKESEVKVIISGSVTLTDNENPDDENSTDADVADAYDGAAIKVKAGAGAYITGTGTLNINGNAKNGIKAGDETALVIDGPTLNITATNDAINGNYDVAILSGKLTISAGDDALHADRVLTVGEDGDGPSITIKTCTEGVEATVVNLAGGTVNVTSTDDGVNAANSDGTYASLGYSINVTGANVTVNAPRADGLDSNGNINLISGSATISSANNGGDAGLDYDGQLYISDEFDLNNQSGVSNMGGGMMGGMPGQMGGMQQGTQQAPNQNGNQQMTNQSQQAPAQNNAQQPGQQNNQPQQNQNMAPAQDQQGMAISQFGAPGQQQAPDQGMNQMPAQNTAPAQNMAPAQNNQGAMGGQFGAPNQNGNPMQGGMGMNQMPGMQNQMGMQGGGQMPMQNQTGMQDRGQMPMQNQGMMGGMNGSPNAGGFGGRGPQMGGMGPRF